MKLIVVASVTLTSLTVVAQVPPPPSDSILGSLRALFNRTGDIEKPNPVAKTMMGAQVLTILDATAAPVDRRLFTQLAEAEKRHNWRLADIPALGIQHSDGSDWLAKVTAPDGKPAWRFRLKQGQPFFQGDTLRAEVFAGFRDATAGVREGGDYWMAIDWYFDADMFDTGGASKYGPDSVSLFDLHGQPAFSGTPASGYHGMAFRLTQDRRLTFHTFSEQGTAPGKIYDVSNGLSTQVLSTVESQPGGPHGTPNTWILDRATRAGVWYRFVLHFKLAATAAGGPQLQLYRKLGSGALLKIIDSHEPNTGGEPGSYRFQKRGLYKFDGTFGTKPTRTFLSRSWLILRNEGVVDATSLMSWMER